MHIVWVLVKNTYFFIYTLLMWSLSYSNAIRTTAELEGVAQATFVIRTRGRSDVIWTTTVLAVLTAATFVLVT